MLENRGVLPKEEGELIRENQATHKENFLSSWVRDGTEGKAEDVIERDRKDKEEEAESGKSEVEEGWERVKMDGERVCFGFCSGLTPEEVSILLRFGSVGMV